jgi:hypothetical protein
VLGVEDKLAQIVGEASLIGVKSFLTTVLSSVVNRDANGFGELNSKADRFDFIKSEALAYFGSMAVSDGLASDGGSKLIKRSGRGGDGIGSSGCESSLLAAGLIEPDADVSLPVLPEMDVGDDVVMLYHLSTIIIIFNKIILF